jgi:hypothetical protein
MSQCTLAKCPIGLFMSQDSELCLKTEYGNNEGRIDAYIVSSGEFFWGAKPQTIASQRSEVVTPVENVTLQKRPVAYRAPNGNGGWVVTQDEQEAIDVADGADYQGLYVREPKGAFHDKSGTNQR